jgi:hypothetical protein
MSTLFGSRIEGQRFTKPGAPAPFYVREHLAFAGMDPNERVAWFTEQANAAIGLGARFIRYSIDHPTKPTRGLIEAWPQVMDPYRMPPIAWPARPPQIQGEYSAIEDCHRLVVDRTTPQPQQERLP